MADLTFDEFARGVAASTDEVFREQAPNVSMTKLRSVFDHLVATGVDVRAVLEGKQKQESWVDKQLRDPEIQRELLRRADLTPLRELAAHWQRMAAAKGNLAHPAPEPVVRRACAESLLAELDAIEKGGA